MINMPFGKFKDFSSCVLANKDKDDPEAYCAQIQKDITGKWPSEKEMISSSIVLMEAKMEESPDGKYDQYQKIDKKLNPIEENPEINPNKYDLRIPSENIPEDKEAKKIMTELEALDIALAKNIKADPDKDLKKADEGAFNFESYLQHNKTFQHQIEKKVYVQNPSDAPKGVSLHRGAKGGYYFEDEKPEDKTVAKMPASPVVIPKAKVD